MNTMTKQSGCNTPRTRGFTLMEAMFASTILFSVVIAVISAVSAGQQHAHEAHLQIAGSLAAEDLMGRLTVENYATLPTWNGYNEAVGAMVDMKNQPMPDNFSIVGRNVQVLSVLENLSDLGVLIQGREVTVRTVDEDGRVLTELVRFIPEPQP